MKFLTGILVLTGAGLWLPNVAGENDNDGVVNKQIKWLRSKGGVFSNKIEFAPLDKSDSNSPNGMFASSPIQKGEEVILVPADSLITSGPSNDMCDTARNLLHEYTLEDESEFEPYVTYVFESFNYHQHPLLWSENGKKLFNVIVGDDNLPPYEFGMNTFKEKCDISDDDDYDLYGASLEAAWTIIVSRGWGEVLVPVYDMINHRNGHWHNIDQANSAHIEEDISVIAIRDIAIGEQLYLSYNECNDIDCDGIEHTYTLPAMTMDYGFVEQYPRRFDIETLYDTKLVFELDVKNNSSTGDDDDKNKKEQVMLTWLNPPTTSEEDLDWLGGQLERLGNLKDTVFRAVKLLPSHEKSLIVEYYNVLKMAFEVVIESSTNPQTEFDSLTGATSV